MAEGLRERLLAAALLGKDALSSANDWLSSGVPVGVRLRQLDRSTTPIPRKKPSPLPTPEEAWNDPNMQGAAGFLGSIRGANLIKDWMWRSAPAVKKELGLTEVAPHVQSVFGPFMQQQAQRASAGELGAEDLLKAYGITRSSVNRAARGGVRPEGHMADWLLTPAGQDYLAAARAGKADPKAIADLVEGFQPFGMAETLGKDLSFGAENLGPTLGERLGPAVTGSKGDWREFAQELPGIGPAKS